MAAIVRMRGGLQRERGEPGRLPAFLLAGLIHAAFAVLLVFGVSWQTRTPAPLQAELWSSLPAVKEAEPAPIPPRVEPEPPPPPPVEVKTPPPPPQPSKADIELKEKLEKEKKLKIEREKREQEEAKVKRAADEKRRLEDEKKRKEDEKRKADDRAQKAADAKAKADAQAALTARTQAQQRIVNEWSDKIKALVLSKANVPETVSGFPEVQIRLKLLVNGAVFEGVVVKRSGNRVYDEAVERAVASIREWPTPSDADVFRNYREVTLNLKHDK